MSSGCPDGALIDDTEATNWERRDAVPDVSGSQVTVDLAGEVQSVDRVQVSAMLAPGQNRFTALRAFKIRVCAETAANLELHGPNVGFTTIFTSPPDAFPGFNPGPVALELILRSFDVPRT